ncbi:MAG: FecR domain-containing protein, partial [Planctomycetota bacterium]|nr:FecR domain-containing protein [Planctomycetota bacterium]
AKVGDQLSEGMDLRTGFRARCVLEMNRNTLQVDPLAVIRIGELRRQGDTVRTRILLKQGNTESNVEKGGTKNDFAIVTPTATLSVRGTHGVEAGYFPGFGGNYGLTGDGLTNLANSLTGARTYIAPGQNTNDNAMPPGQFLAQQFLPNNIDPLAFEQNEQNANGRTHTGLPAPPLGGSSGGLSTLSLTGGGGPPPPPPPPKPRDDYGDF